MQVPSRGPFYSHLEFPNIRGLYVGLLFSEDNQQRGPASMEAAIRISSKPALDPPQTSSNEPYRPLREPLALRALNPSTTKAISESISTSISRPVDSISPSQGPFHGNLGLSYSKKG